MNKEEQRESLYRTLLQRNSLNSQIIRKYRKKSTNYYKNLQKKSEYTSAINTENNNDTGSTQNIVKIQETLIENEKKDNVLFNNQPCINQMQRQKSKQRQELRLPSINGAYNRVQSMISVTANKNNRRQVQLRTQISMSIGCMRAQNNKIVAQTNENSQPVIQSAPTCPSFASKEHLNVKKHLQKDKISNVSQSVRHTTLQSVIKKTSNAMGAEDSNNTHNYTYNYNYNKRQARTTNSHKALLNLQEIVFQSNLQRSNINNNTKNNNNNNNSKYYGKESSFRNENQSQNKNMPLPQQACQNNDENNINNRCISKQKNKKNNMNSIYRETNRDRDRVEQKQNVCQLYQKQSGYNNCNCNYNCNCKIFNSKVGMQNLSNMIVKQLNNNSKQNNLSGLINANSVSLSPLSILNLTNINTNNDNIPTASKPQHKQQTRIINHENLDKNKQLQAQLNLISYTKLNKPNAPPLPNIHMHKLKQFRLNFHRFAKSNSNNKDVIYEGLTHNYNINNNQHNVNNSIKNNHILNKNGQIFHNHSYSLNSIGQISQKDKDIFKIQALPAHIIKWM